MRYPICLFFLLLFSCQAESPKQAYHLELQSSDLPSFFDFSEDRIPLVSAHRGGRNIKGFPENALETFKMVSEQGPVIIECDVNLTKDSVLILMHDDDLDRTTTGTGFVGEQPWDEIKNLKLVDDFGNTTSFSVPLFEEVLNWAKDRHILAIDVKREVPFRDVIDLIKATETESIATVISYSLEDAMEIHSLDSTLMVSVSIGSLKDLQNHLEAGIPANKMMAFTGTRQVNPTLNKALKAYGIPVTLGTFSTVDDEPAWLRSAAYKDLLSQGVDIIATDRPIEVSQLILEDWESNESPKQSFFKRD